MADLLYDMFGSGIASSRKLKIRRRSTVCLIDRPHFSLPHVEICIDQNSRRGTANKKENGGLGFIVVITTLMILPLVHTSWVFKFSHFNIPLYILFERNNLATSFLLCLTTKMTEETLDKENDATSSVPSLSLSQNHQQIGRKCLGNRPQRRDAEDWEILNIY